MKTLIATSLLLLAVAACGGSGTGSAPATSAAPGDSPSPAVEASTAPSPSSAAAESTNVVVKDFTLDPKEIAVKGAVSLAVTNQGPTIHNITIRDAAGAIVGRTKDLGVGESETLTAEIPAGKYTLFCSLPGHESLGIKGTLTVGE